MLSETLKKMDPAVLSAALSNANRNSGSSKRPRDEDDDDENDHNNQEELSDVKRCKQNTNNEREIKAKNGLNEYNGFCVPTKNYTIPSIPFDDALTPEKFYSDYVSQRRPVVLRRANNIGSNSNNNVIGEDLGGLDKWKDNNDHLRKHAGNEHVMVEVRSNEHDSFGRGNEIGMSFNNFLDLVESGDSKHYLTTQDVAANDDGQPDLMAAFMKSLQNDFPLRPKIMGNLIPQNINLWMGNNKDGASSGLHHDYHDNLYILLRGRKKFRLYSPKDTEKIPKRGNLYKVHPNGRINYDGEETTAYGADLKSDAAAKASRAKEDAEQKLIDAEKAVEEGKPGAQEQLERAEEMLEQAMDALIDAEMGSDDDDGDDESGGEDGEDKSQDDDDDINGECNNEEEETLSDKEEDLKTSRNLVDKTVKDPNNFSIIDPKMLLDEEQLNTKFPEMKHTTPAFCSLEVGDILYLPASWWHEVNSVGGANGHLALNYWFHPPDSSNNFESPYSTDFWSNDYKLRFGNSTIAK